MDNKEAFLKIGGWILIIVGLLNLILGFYIGKPWRFLWLCYLGAIIGGIGMIRKSPTLILSQLNILLLIIFFWDLDFIYRLFNLGIDNVMDKYFLTTGAPIAYLEPFHLLILPLFFISLYLIKIDRTDAWKISVLQLILVFLVIVGFTNPAYNINCVFHPDALIDSLRHYTLAWILLFPLSTILINYVIVRTPIFKKRVNFQNV
jgi:hypothetical protein